MVVTFSGRYALVAYPLSDERRFRQDVKERLTVRYSLMILVGKFCDSTTSTFRMSQNLAFTENRNYADIIIQL